MAISWRCAIWPGCSWHGRAEPARATGLGRGRRRGRLAALMALVPWSAAVGGPAAAVEASAAWIGELTYAIEPEPPAWALRVRGEARVWLREGPGGRLEGQLTGRQEQEIPVPSGPLAPRCAQSLAPAHFAARLEGRRDPAGRLALALHDPQPAAGAVAACGPAPGILHPGPLGEPMLAELLAGLEAKPDGTYAGRLERVTGGSGSTRLVHRYGLVLRPDCVDPEARSGRFERSPFGPGTPADMAPSCGDCPLGRWRLVRGEVSWHPTVSATSPEPSAAIGACAYTYRAIWQCPVDDAIVERRRTLVVEGPCVPRG